MNFDFSKKWDSKKKLPVFNPKKVEDCDTSILNTKCGKCFDLQYNDIESFVDYFMCGFDYRFLPKEAPPYFASECRVFTPLTLYCMKPSCESAVKWLERLNPESRYENQIQTENKEALTKWRDRATRNA